MAQRWYLQDDPAHIVKGGEAIEILRDRLAGGQFETWFQDHRGRLLSIITNGDRAMLMFLTDPEDAGEHLVDLQIGDGFSSGYLLSNGQDDEYADSDTAPLELALEALGYRIETGKRSPSHTWIEDR